MHSFAGFSTNAINMAPQQVIKVIKRNPITLNGWQNVRVLIVDEGEHGRGER